MTVRAIATLCLFAILAASGYAQDDARFAVLVREATVCMDNAASIPDFGNAQCEKRNIENINPQGRVIWIGADITLPAAFIARGKPLAVYIGALASSEIYWNGRLIGSNGVPAASESDEKPGLLDTAFFVPYNLMREGENQIAIKMASFHNLVPVYTPFHYLNVAQPKPLRSPLAFYFVPVLITAGVFVLAALYFGILAVSSRENYGAIFIALTAIFAGGQLFAESLRTLWAYEYPWQIWRLIVVMICAAGFSLSITTYLTRRFQPEKWKYYMALAVALVVVAAIFAPGFDGKAMFGLLGPLVVTLVAVASPAIAGMTGARPVAAVLVGFLALAAIDGPGFMDRTFFYIAAIMTLVLFADQARTMRAIKRAKEEMRGRAERLELELLRRRIAPHFLMNTLNALVEWVESDPRTGVKMIGALAEEFRLLAHMSNRAFVPLIDEIALCRRHLEVMSYRVDRSFSLVTNGVDERLSVPPGIIHTLIENAFTHGRFANGAEFTLNQTKEEDGRIILTFSTPAPVDSVAPTKGQGGEGLAYVKKRLAAAFGMTASFSDGPGVDGSWISTLSFDAAGP